MVETDSTTLRPESRSTTRDIDGQTPASVTTAMALADHYGVDPVEVPCLYEYVDPEALDTLVAHRDEERATSVSIRFELETATVRLDGTGTVTVRSTSEAAPTQSRADTAETTSEERR
ncbi:hypothetical protein HT576_09765 [Haloterrigena sp. SYSU A121-1]|uniref:Halobacterial output domain-containing protein n=1 Tax=Haloterrigena gelatinilytica TaxID=2741724 RepID=A0A8J8KHM2_9EURY|nr:HalOD1 output domain-containing protein [Haloterrigena gelatinilytica]NUB91304.1 hypothetical protein [Haloterrigena gelatinilytica]